MKCNALECLLKRQTQKGAALHFRTGGSFIIGNIYENFPALYMGAKDRSNRSCYFFETYTNKGHVNFYSNQKPPGFSSSGSKFVVFPTIYCEKIEKDKKGNDVCRVTFQEPKG